MPSGLIGPDMPFTQYSLHSGLNQSKLKYGLDSTMELHYRIQNPPKLNGDFQLGTAIHTAILEPEVYFARRKVVPSVHNPVTKRANRLRIGASEDAWQQAAEVYPDSLVLSPDMVPVVERMQAAFDECPDARGLLDSATGVEHSVFWTEGDIDLKARIDIVGDGWIADIKTTKDPSRRQFTRKFGDLSYHLQAAMYIRGMYKATGTVPEMRVIAMKKVPPYSIQVFDIGQRTVMTGLRQLADILDMWQRYLATKEHSWFGSRPRQIQTIELPSYLLDDDAVFSSRNVSMDREDLIDASF